MIRKLLHIVLIVCLSLQSFAMVERDMICGDKPSESHRTLDFLLKDQLESQKQYQSTLSLLKEKQKKYESDRLFLQYIYSKVHRKNLKSFKKQVTLDQTLSKAGYYNCLTGTLLYGFLLEELGFHITIREFSYHVSLIVHLEKEDILIESTDPINGFVVGTAAINHRIEEIKAKEAQKKRCTVYDIATDIDNCISLQKLAGLHFYNQAVFHLNDANVTEAKSMIRKALAFYPSKRIEEITRLIFVGDLASVDD